MDTDPVTSITKEELIEVRAGRKLNVFFYPKEQCQSRTTIFFLPGSLACHDVDAQLISYFKDRYSDKVNIIAYDAYGRISSYISKIGAKSSLTISSGSGKSDRPRDWDEYGTVLGHYSTANLFSDALALVHKYASPSRNVLIG